MDEHMSRTRSEDGTTLVELLVVMVLLGVIGSITTVGVVQSFRTQLEVTGAAESLDESRLAIQRMREVIRGADEICASSDATRLAVWTDGATGSQGDDEDVEVVIFEVDASTNRLTRRTRASGSPEVLISDEIITSAVFGYDVPPDQQVEDLRCQTDTDPVTTPSTSRTSRVEIQLEVNNAASDVPLTTQTAVQLRNAGLNALRTGLVGSENQPPDAVIWAPEACLVGVECPLDGRGSSDPEGATLNYAWDLDGDGATDDSTAPAPLWEFTEEGEATVILVVQDDEADTGHAVKPIKILSEGSNLPPDAAFTYDCDGDFCWFDAVGGSRTFQSEPDVVSSSDPAADGTDDDQLSFEWYFDGGEEPYSTADVFQAPRAAFGDADKVTVELRVTDSHATDAKSATSTETITVGPNPLVVKSLRAVAGTSTGAKDPYEVTLTVNITTITDPPDGVGGAEVTVSASVGFPQTDSCTTSATGGDIGQCTFSTFSVPDGESVTFTINSVIPPDDTYTYAPEQSHTTITVSEGDTVEEPS